MDVIDVAAKWRASEHRRLLTYLLRETSWRKNELNEAPMHIRYRRIRAAAIQRYALQILELAELDMAFSCRPIFTGRTPAKQLARLIRHHQPSKEKST